MYEPGMENARRTHENAVKRIERWTMSERFKIATTPELETSQTMLENSFLHFTVEHQKLVVKLRDPEKYKLEDAFYSSVEELYRRAIIRYRSQLDQIVREQALRSIARRTREVVTARTTAPKEQLTDEKQQQKEREQRRRQELNMNNGNSVLCR